MILSVDSHLRRIRDGAALLRYTADLAALRPELPGPSSVACPLSVNAAGHPCVTTPTASISTRRPAPGRPETSTVVRAGRWSPNILA